jgi:uncharacterized membrane protein YraQ (UPF0718 family)
MKTGAVMLIIVVLIYIALYLMGVDSVFLALKYSLKTLKKLSFVFVVVFVMMFLIDMFVDDKKISKYFNKKGIKAYLIAMIAGVLSHGSSYAWYPLLENLRKKGVKDSLIITFLYARSIKIPWIPMMIAYFGSGFTIILIIYTMIASLIQGLIVKQFEKDINGI